MMKIRDLNLLLILTIILSTSCNSNDDDSNDCSNLVCNTEFKIITVSILNKKSEKVTLDDFKIIDIDSGIDLTPSEDIYSLEFAQETGLYPIVTDGSIELNTIREMTFIGFINNEEVIRSNYTAEEQCCGVNLTSGNLNLTIN